MSKDNAGIFFYGTPPSPSQIASLADGAEVTKTVNDNVTSVTLKWQDVTVTISINPEWARETQLAGIRGWLSSFPDTERKSKAVITFLADLDKTTTSYGTVITPNYDKNGKVTSLLKRLVEKSGGFFFSHQSFYSAAGSRITGMDGDPSMLGHK